MTINDDVSDTPDGRPARAQRELDRLAAERGNGPKGWNIPSRAGARGPAEDAMVDGWNVSSLN